MILLTLKPTKFIKLYSKVCTTYNNILLPPGQGLSVQLNLLYRAATWDEFEMRRAYATRGDEIIHYRLRGMDFKSFRWQIQFL